MHEFKLLPCLFAGPRLATMYIFCTICLSRVPDSNRAQ